MKANPEYFDSVGTHVVMGRDFTLQDKMHAPPVAVVNQEFVKQFFGKRNPIGHYFWLFRSDHDRQGWGA